ncbi:MAG: thiamine-phosphate kinase, partial [Planctomycetota bacterium]
MNEREIIRRLARGLPRSERQVNDLFDCDAEIVEIGGALWGLTLDEFTPGEDRFSSEDPGRLAANLATATLSDLLAAGCRPQFFMHAVALPPSVDPSFLEAFTTGLRAVLENANCAFLGGDTGSGPGWRYSGFAMGPVSKDRPLTRRIPKVAQHLWVTGQLGDANLAAFYGSPTPRFELRLAEAELARETATACIDTSSGFLDAVWFLSERNPGMRFRIDLEALPLAEGLEHFAKETGAPKEAALLGGAGEYELLFTTPADPPPSAE